MGAIGQKKILQESHILQRNHTHKYNIGNDLDSELFLNS